MIVLLLLVSFVHAATVTVLGLDGGVDAGSEAYLVAGIERAEREGHAAVVIEVDTPGGLAYYSSSPP